MVRLLTKLFVKHSEDIKNPAVRRAYGTMVAIVCILLNVILFAFKFIVGTLAGSVSIRADAINNLSDAGSSVISLVCFKISAKPADRDHPFGHARIEYVASLAVSFLILLIGFELVRDSIEKMLAPVGIDFSLVAVIVLGCSVLIKLWMAFFNRAIGKRIDSEVMRATAADSLSDVIATGAVLLATVASRFLPERVSVYVDPVMGVIVAILIFVAGLKILNETKNSILGEAPADEVVESIRTVVAEYPDILGIHDLVVHNYGPGRTLASFHAEVDGARDVFASHDTIDLIERRLYEEHGIECAIHLDPIVTDDPVLNEWRERVAILVHGIDAGMKIHDFRMVPGTTHTNLIFDVAVPYECAVPPDEIVRTIKAAVQKADPAYFAVITLDHI